MRTWVVSYGGSGTNWINNTLAPDVVDREWWRHGPCHAPAPIPDAPCDLAIYVYRRPADAFHSQLRRGLVPVNQRKLGHPGPVFTPERFAQAMIEQMRAWKAASCTYPVMLIRYESIPDHIESVIDHLLAAGASKAAALRAFTMATPRGVRLPPNAQTALARAERYWQTMPDFALRSSLTA